MRLQTFILVFITTIISGYSQMAPAKKVKPNVQESITVDRNENVVWDYILKFNNLYEYGSGIIAETVVKGEGLNATRQVTFKNGNKREEQLVYFNKTQNKISIEVLNLKDTFSQYFYIFEIEKVNKDKTKITLNAVCNYQSGIKDKKGIEKHISEEFKVLLKGIKIKLEK